MNDLAIAALLMGLLISLAITAPIWGYDSRDGVESDQPARRTAWLQPHDAAAGGRRSPEVAGVLVAGMLRSMAYRLDADAAADERLNGTTATAC